MSAGILGGLLQGVGKAGYDIASDNIAYQQKVDFQRELMAMEEQKMLRAHEIRGRQAKEVDDEVNDRVAKESVPDEQFSDAPVGIVAGARKQPKSFSDAEKAQMKAEAARRRGIDSKDYEQDRSYFANEDSRKEERNYRVQRDAMTDADRKADNERADKQLGLSQAAEARAQKDYEQKNDPAGKSMLAEGMDLIARGDKEAGMKSLRVAAVHYGNPDAMAQLTKLANNGMVDRSTVAQLAAQWGKVAEDPMATDEDKAFARSQQKSLLGFATENKTSKATGGTSPGPKQTVGTGAPTKEVNGVTYVKVPGGWQKQ